MTSKHSDTDDNYDWIRPDRPSKCTYKLGQPLNESPHNHDVKITEKPKILPDILSCIHNTPMVQINNITKMEGIKCQMFAKCEFFNPGGSVKDRIAIKMIEDAEKSGRLKPGCTIIEPTSGNTGIGLALVAAVKGYKCIIVLPEKMSNEKVDVLRALGAEIIRTPTSAAFDHPDSNIRVAERMVKEIPNAVLLNQYTNPSNPVAHYDYTAVEILDAFDGKLDMVVCAAGTGGTISGVARKIKEKCPKCLVIGVDPYGSILAEPEHLNVTSTTFYEVEGIGYDFLPTVFERKYVDKWYKSVDKLSFAMARQLIKHEGLLCGGSSGAAMYCAMKAIKDFNFGPDKKVVIILPDSIRNYMSKFLNDDWLKMRGLYETPDLISNQKWRNEKISTLTFTKLTLLPPDTTVKNAVGLMKSQHVDFVVVATKISIKGTINSKLLLESIMKGNMDVPISKIMNTKYKSLNKNDTLGNLCTLLETEPYVLIMNADPPVKPEYLTISIMKNIGNFKRSESLLGHIKCSHLASYLINH